MGNLFLLLLTVQLSYLAGKTHASGSDFFPPEQVKSSYETILKNWPLCKREIYCTGELLHDVQLMNLFKDSKIFVDFRLKFPEEDILFKYKELKERELGMVSRGKLKEFVEENFERGNELEMWVPTDWKKEPSVLKYAIDEEYKKWLSFLNTMWRVLARRVREDVRDNQTSYSLMWVPNGFIIPGGRFTELYYWDTYWIINGLLLCDMNETVKGVIENLVHLVKVIGHVPNGSRVYYISRSQPPLLIQMVEKYYEATKDWDFVTENFVYLVKEFDYWWDNHMVIVTKHDKQYKMARYFSYDMTPRPESYREDYLVARDFNDKDRAYDFYINIRSGAESGWDFSSRWMVRGETNRGNLSDIATPQIIPVDLNSFLHLNAVILSRWYGQLGNTQKSDEYKEKADILLKGISEVLWDPAEGIWFDYDCLNKVMRKYFYPSNLTPLFTTSYPNSWSRKTLSDSIMDYIRSNNLHGFIGGVPTSLDETGEQWDFPNAWGPLQAIIVQGLQKLGTTDSKEVAFTLAEKWILANFKGFKISRTMFEKYDVLRPGQSGEGGEYIPQTGFGWTNGVILEFFATYGSKIQHTVSIDDITILKEIKSHKSNATTGDYNVNNATDDEFISRISVEQHV